MRTANEIIADGMQCLTEKLGAYETAVFISEIKRGSSEFNNNKFCDIPDYTEWRRDKFDDMTLDELCHAAAEYSRKLHENDN